jgi:hypothetical protein
MGGWDGALFLLLAAVFSAANAFYVVCSKPSLKPSDWLARAANTLASTSVELRHRADEARERESQAEMVRARAAQQETHKLKAAEEFLSYVRHHGVLPGRDAAGMRRVTGPADATARAALPLGNPRLDPGGSPNREPDSPDAPLRFRPEPTSEASAELGR